MTFDPTRHHRRSIRLQGYDYAQPGAYFITVCTRGRACLFGTVEGGVMRLNALGDIVWAAWDGLPHHYTHVVRDRFVVMPNHVHGIVRLSDAPETNGGNERTGGDATGDAERTVGAGLKPAPTPPPPAPTAGVWGKRHRLPEIVRAFKTFSARRINERRRTPGTPVWQRNYYEHIIRDEHDYRRIAAYIEQNPQRWAEDALHPGSAGFRRDA